MNPPTVALLPVTLKKHVVQITTHGVVRPRATSVVGAEVAGRVVWVHPALANGILVAAGEELLRTDNTDYLAAYAEAEAQLSLRQKEYAEEQVEGARAQREWAALGQGEASDFVLRKPQLAAAHARIIAAEAQVKKARVDIDRCTVRAPYTARIISKNVDLGSRINPGSELLTLEAADAYEVALPLTLEQLRYVTLPLRGEIVTDGPRVSVAARIGGKMITWTGAIVRTEAQISEQNRMISAMARIEQPRIPNAEPLLSGLFVSATIFGREISDAVEIPLSALQTDDEIYVLRPTTGVDGVSEKRSATIIERGEKSVVVQGDFVAGDLVIINHVAGIHHGMLARREPPAAAPSADNPSALPAATNDAKP
jgi:membrane fusion protein, multidrug efflux system